MNTNLRRLHGIFFEFTIHKLRAHDQQRVAILFSPSGLTSVPGHARSVPCHVILVPFRPIPSQVLVTTRNIYRDIQGTRYD